MTRYIYRNTTKYATDTVKTKYVKYTKYTNIFNIEAIKNNIPKYIQYLQKYTKQPEITYNNIFKIAIHKQTTIIQKQNIQQTNKIQIANKK